MTRFLGRLPPFIILGLSLFSQWNNPLRSILNTDIFSLEIYQWNKTVVLLDEIANAELEACKNIALFS